MIDYVSVWTKMIHFKWRKLVLPKLIKTNGINQNGGGNSAFKIYCHLLALKFTLCMVQAMPFEFKAKLVFYNSVSLLYDRYDRDPKKESEARSSGLGWVAAGCSLGLPIPHVLLPGRLAEGGNMTQRWMGEVFAVFRKILFFLRRSSPLLCSHFHTHTHTFTYRHWIEPHTVPSIVFPPQKVLQNPGPTSSPQEDWSSWWWTLWSGFWEPAGKHLCTLRKKNIRIIRSTHLFYNPWVCIAFAVWPFCTWTSKVFGFGVFFSFSE